MDMEEEKKEEGQIKRKPPLEAQKKKGSSFSSLFSGLASVFGGGSKASAKKMEKKDQIEVKLEEEDADSHEAYLARNNSASEMDEDDLDGELNLSDDGGDAVRGKLRTENESMRSFMPKKKARKYRHEFDTNVTQVSLSCLANKAEVATGDPFICSRC